MSNQLVTIRTWDLGADKVAQFLPEFPRETNPVLGLRAIRMCLKNQDMFREQIRAILRISENSPIRILIPMVTNVDEIIKTKRIIQQEMLSLKLRNSHLQFGCMIETPSRCDDFR